SLRLDTKVLSIDCEKSNIAENKYSAYTLGISRKEMCRKMWKCGVIPGTMRSEKARAKFLPRHFGNWCINEIFV
ncbi:hypothetical protein KIN20_019464, partial [Parelaphostrongylus tenuis]